MTERTMSSHHATDKVHMPSDVGRARGKVHPAVARSFQDREARADSASALPGRDGGGTVGSKMHLDRVSHLRRSAWFCFAVVCLPLAAAMDGRLAGLLTSGPKGERE